MTPSVPEQPIIRPLDPGESFFYMSDLVSCMNFVVFAERRGHLQPERLRQALDLVQQENLLLQAGIRWTQEDGLCFVHAPGRPVELRCHSVTPDDWQHIIEQQLSEPFPAEAAPLMRCLYLQMPAPARSVLALCFHHAIADGRSGTALLRRLLSVMAAQDQPSPGTGPTALPAMAKVHPARYRWPEQADAARALKATLIADYRRHGPLPAIPWLASEATERTPRFIRLSLAPEHTRRLLAAARAQGTTRPRCPVRGATAGAAPVAIRLLMPPRSFCPVRWTCARTWNRCHRRHPPACLCR